MVELMGRPLSPPRVWSEAEIAELRRLHPTMRNDEIARVLGRSKMAVDTRVSKLGLADRMKTSRLRHDRWTDDEMATLRSLAPTTPYAEIAKQLGRSKQALDQKAFELGIEGRPHAARARGEDSVHWKGGRIRYGREWYETIRPQVLERDGFTCQECGLFAPSGRGLAAHHIIPFRVTWRNRLGELVTLCIERCHPRQAAHRWTEWRPELIKTLPDYQQRLLEVS